MGEVKAHQIFSKVAAVDKSLVYFANSIGRAVRAQTRQRLGWEKISEPDQVSFVVGADGNVIRMDSTPAFFHDPENRVTLAYGTGPLRIGDVEIPRAKMLTAKVARYDRAPEGMEATELEIGSIFYTTELMVKDKKFVACGIVGREQTPPADGSWEEDVRSRSEADGMLVLMDGLERGVPIENEKYREKVEAAKIDAPHHRQMISEMYKVKK